MPYQPVRSLAAFFMGDTLADAVKWSPSIFGSVKFGGLKMGLFQFMLICLDAYIKGTAVGYTFRDKHDLLVSMMVKPDKVKKYADYLQDVAQKRVKSYNQEITSIIDFFITTELLKDKLTFDDFLEKAKGKKAKVKIDAAGPGIKLVFEEGTSFGASYPEIVSKVISPENKTSSLDWQKAKLFGFTFDINAQELDLEFLRKWAIHNLRTYASECFPELVAPLGL